VIACLLSFGQGYEASLHSEIDRMGMQMMIVPLGCPYDAAARVLKGRALDTSLPADALLSAQADANVAVAAPLFTSVVPRPDEGRTDLWVGIDSATRRMKPWWKLTPGSTWFTGPHSVILGAEAAATEMRKPGDKFLSPETGQSFVVSGVLERSGTSDDSQFFVPLGTAQSMFHQPGRLTAIAIRLKDPSGEANDAAVLQAIPGAQVVTLTEMMGTFLNLLGSARTLILAIAMVAIVISSLSVFNTMMAAVIERTQELGVLRAVGMRRESAFAMMIGESLLLTLLGGAIGFLIALFAGPAIQSGIRPYVPLAPDSGMPVLTWDVVGRCLSMIVAVGLIVGVYPAWRASRLSPAVAQRVE
jgi:putative ABC transport system permease protein